MKRFCPTAPITAVRLILPLVGRYSSSPDGNLSEGIGYYENEEYQQAVDAFTKIIRTDPRHVDAYLLQGAAHSMLGQYQGAIKDFDTAIRLKPDHALGYYNKGYAYDELGKFESAITEYDKAIKLNPDLGVVYLKRRTELSFVIFIAGQKIVLTSL